jgi:peptidoglycan/LPS O-acetylase OafA/YrhL
MVVFGHKLNSFHGSDIGRCGVHLFFVLSGFLIIGILAPRRAMIEVGKSAIWPELKHFYENRVFRIWPIYFLH